MNGEQIKHKPEKKDGLEEEMRRFLANQNDSVNVKQKLELEKRTALGEEEYTGAINNSIKNWTREGIGNTLELDKRTGKVEKEYDDDFTRDPEWKEMKKEFLKEEVNPEDPEDLEIWVNRFDEVHEVYEHQKTVDKVLKTYTQHEQDIGIVEDRFEWDDVTERWFGGDYSSLPLYMIDLWGQENWDKFTAWRSSETEEGVDTVIDPQKETREQIGRRTRWRGIEYDEYVTSTNFASLKNSISRYLKFEDNLLPHPPFVVPMNENQTVMYKDKVSEKEGTNKVLERDLKPLGVELEALGYEGLWEKYEDTLSDEVIARVRETNPEEAVILLAMQSRIQAGLTNLQPHYDGYVDNIDMLNKVNRPRSANDMRILGLAQVYRDILGFEDVPDWKDLSLTSEELNQGINIVIAQAVDRELDHDTGMLVLDLYNKSFKNFKEVSRSMSVVNASRNMATTADHGKRGRQISPNDSMIQALMTGEGANARTIMNSIKDYGWDAQDPETKDNVMEWVNNINTEAAEMFEKNFGIDVPGGVRLLNIEKVQNGEWGLDFANMDPMQFWVAGTWIISDLAHSDYGGVTPNSAQALGKFMIDKMQSIEQKYGSDALIDPEQIKRHPEAARDFLMVLGLMGDMNRLSGQMRGQGKQWMDKIFAQTGDNFLSKYIRSLSLGLNENLEANPLFGIKLPEFLDLWFKGGDQIQMEIKGEMKTVSPVEAYRILLQTMSSVNKDMIEALLYMVEEDKIGTFFKEDMQTADSFNRITGPAGGMSRVGYTTTKGYLIDSKTQSDLRNIQISYMPEDNEEYWDNQWSSLTPYIQNILDPGLTEVIEGLATGNSHDKMITLFNTYLNNTSTREIIQGISQMHIVDGEPISIASLLTRVDSMLGQFDVTAFLDDVSTTGTVKIGFLPGTAPERLNEVPNYKEETRGASKARTLTDMRYFVNTDSVYWIPENREASNFGTFEGGYFTTLSPESKDRGLGPVSQDTIDHINNITWKNMRATFDDHYLASIGYDPQEGGKQEFIRDIMGDMWWQEAQSWGDKDVEWVPRTILDWSIGASEFLYRELMTQDTAVPDYLELIGFFKNLPTDKYGRFKPRSRAELVLEKRVDTPLGGNPKDPEKSPELNLFVNGADGVERPLTGMGWTIGQEDVDYYFDTQQSIEERIGNKSLIHAWAHTGETGTRLGYSGAIEGIVREISLPIKQTMNILSDLMMRSQIHGAEIRGVPEEIVQNAEKRRELINMIRTERLNDAEYAIVLEINKHRFYRDGAYPHWWNTGNPDKKWIKENIKDLVNTIGREQKFQRFRP